MGVRVKRNEAFTFAVTPRETYTLEKQPLKPAVLGQSRLISPSWAVTPRALSWRYVESSRSSSCDDHTKSHTQCAGNTRIRDPGITQGRLRPHADGRLTGGGPSTLGDSSRFERTPGVMRRALHCRTACDKGRALASPYPRLRARPNGGDAASRRPARPRLWLAAGWLTLVMRGRQSVPAQPGAVRHSGAFEPWRRRFG
jgi:hypothetical protein